MERDGITIFPTLQIRSKSIIFYNRIEWSGRSKKLLNWTPIATRQLVECSKYTGQMTNGSRKRLTKAVSLLVQSSTPRWIKNPVTGKRHYFQLSFITLTIPKQPKATDARFTHKHLLEPMLRVLRRRHQLKSYVWKAELQANGSVHYHITSDIFINHTDLRNEWNAILARNGMLDGYYSDHGNYNANSTDIHSVKKVRNMEAYLVKYVTKAYQNSKALSGKVWDCSLNLKRNGYWTIDADSSYEQILNKAVDDKQVTSYASDNFTIYTIRNSSVKALLLPKDRGIYSYYLKQIRLWTPQQQSKPETLATALLAGSYSLEPSILAGNPETSLRSSCNSKPRFVQYHLQL